jgi:hypothetical protein
MCCLPSDFEDLDFLDLEILRTRENDLPVQSGVVGVKVAKGSETEVCVGVIGNTNATIPKDWTLFGITRECLVLLFGF